LSLHAKQKQHSHFVAGVNFESIQFDPMIANSGSGTEHGKPSRQFYLKL